MSNIEFALIEPAQFSYVVPSQKEGAPLYMDAIGDKIGEIYQICLPALCIASLAWVLYGLRVRNQIDKAKDARANPVPQAREVMVDRDQRKPVADTIEYSGRPEGMPQEDEVTRWSELKQIINIGNVREQEYLEDCAWLQAQVDQLTEKGKTGEARQKLAELEKLTAAYKKELSEM